MDTRGKLIKYVKAFGTDRQGALLWFKEEPGRIRLTGGAKREDRLRSVTVAVLCDAWLEHVEAPGNGYKD